MAVAVIEDIIGTVVVDGATYLLKKVVGEAGNFIWQLFTDEDGDYVPDDPGNPWDTWDEEPDEWFPFPVNPPEKPDYPVSSLVDIVVITPDGPIILYGENGTTEKYEELVSQANEQWISSYGAIAKPFNNYTVTELLLFIIALCALFGFLGKLFKRRKF